MAHDIKVTNSELWHMLQSRGYEIKISEPGETGSRSVTFDSKFAVNDYTIGTTFGPSYSDWEIIMDVLPQLLRWSGLHLKAVLDY